LILFTSGTTGKPKGVVHSFSTLSYQLKDLHSSWEISSNDEMFFSLPMNHIHGLVTGMLNGLAAGASINMHGQFEAEQAWRRLSDSKTTFFTAVPAIYSKLLAHSRANKRPYDLDHLRLMISGSSPLSEPLLSAWRTEFREKGIVERYGMTETGMISSNNINLAKAGCVGKAFDSIEIKILSNADGFGQVLVRGPGLFKGYLTSGKLKPRDPLEYFNTGDQGYFDVEGDLKLVGRDRDILKVSGYKVGCGEIEAEISNCPGVKECAVIGLIDPRDESNQLIACLIVSDSDDEIASQVRKFLTTRLAHYKIPRKWKVTKDPLPRNLIGKPDNKQIVDFLK
jgi:malonyl-CoA/methylmalonyl-CoA synthetase